MILRSRAGWPNALYVCSIVAMFAMSAVHSGRPLSAQARPKISAHHRSPSSTRQATSTTTQSIALSSQRLAVERPWRDVDIGEPQTEGASAWNGGVIAVVGSGIGSRDTSDQMHFTYSRLTGDGDLVARLIALDDEHPLASGGIMIRSSLAPDAASAGLLGTNLNGIRFERRLGQGWSSLTTSSDAPATQMWLKLERRGFLVTASVSPDGINWTILGADTIELGPDAYVGFAVASHRQSELASATFDSVSISPADDQRDPLDPTPSDGTDPSPQPPIDPGPVPPESSPVPPVTEQPPIGEPVPPTPPPQESTPEPSPILEVPSPVADSTTDPIEPPPAPVASEPLPTIPAAPAPAVPRFLAFDPSPDHDSNVDGYLVDVVMPSTILVPLVRVDIGKPAVVEGECRVELSAILGQLAPGTYVVVVRAMNAAGTSEGAMSAAFTI